MKKKVVIIAGPTAVGKTKFAIEVAKYFNGEIVSADSMQIYQYMDIGNAKPTPSELAQVRHHLVDQIDPRDEFSVAEYQALAKECIREILNHDKLPVISGGTGLYLNSLIYDMNFSIMPKQDTIREKLEKDAIEYGNEYVHDKLKSLDPKAADRIHPNNLKKVIRALEVLESSGVGIKDFKESFIKTQEYDTVLIGLSRDREELYRRIEERVDLLVEFGLIEEVQSLLDKGLQIDHISMKGIGYKEIIGYLAGEYDRQEAIRLVKRNTRHYAKRQLTWLRRYEDIAWFDLSNYQDDATALDAILKYCESMLADG